MKKKEAKEYIKETLTLKLSLAGYEEELGGAYTHNDHLIHFPKNCISIVRLINLQKI